MKIRGSVSLAAREWNWKNPFKPTYRVKVNLKDEPAFIIRRTVQPMRLTAQYDLLNLKKSIVQSWMFKFGGNNPSLDLTIQDYPLRYKMDPMGTPTFVTMDGEFPAFFEQSSRSRAFVLDDMHFKHIDFQSEMHFVCPEERLHQAIMIANFLFNPFNLAND